MTSYVKQLKEELENCRCMPLFEIEVTDMEGNQDWISAEIFFQGNSLIAKRDGVSTKELKSKKIANNRVVVDDCFGLDEHLQFLHEEITDSIVSGDLYKLV